MQCISEHFGYVYESRSQQTRKISALCCRLIMSNRVCVWSHACYRERISMDFNLLILLVLEPSSSRGVRDILCLFTSTHTVQGTHKRPLESAQKKSKQQRRKRVHVKREKLRAKCQKKKTDEPLRVVLRVSLDCWCVVAGVRPEKFNYERKKKQNPFFSFPSEKASNTHNLSSSPLELLYGECGVCRVGRSLIQFHCLSRASEINQKKKKTWFRLRSDLPSHSPACLSIARASRRTVGRNGRGKAK